MCMCACIRYIFRYKLLECAVSAFFVIGKTRGGLRLYMSAATKIEARAGMTKMSEKMINESRLGYLRYLGLDILLWSILERIRIFFETIVHQGLAVSTCPASNPSAPIPPCPNMPAHGCSVISHANSGLKTAKINAGRMMPTLQTFQVVLFFQGTSCKP